MFKPAPAAALGVACVALPADADILELSTTYLETGRPVRHVAYACMDEGDIPARFAGGQYILDAAATEATQGGVFLALAGDVSVLLVNAACLERVRAGFAREGVAETALVVGRR